MNAWFKFMRFLTVNKPPNKLICGIECRRWKCPTFAARFDNSCL